MSELREDVKRALRRLSKRAGFQRRPGQEQAALIIADAMDGLAPVMIEAPTGSGKSLAALIPALAYAKRRKRVVIATYTNVLAEQYWRKDLPVALSLFDWRRRGRPKTAFLVGRNRYACKVELTARADRPIIRQFLDTCENGTDSEFFGIATTKEERRLWMDVTVPPACAGRRCKHYSDCYFFRARDAARRADIVITNHSLFINDVLVKNATLGMQTILGPYDFAIIDEVHDFPQAAESAFCFTLDNEVLHRVHDVIERSLNEQVGRRPGTESLLRDARRKFIEGMQRADEAYGRIYHRVKPGILAVAPNELLYDANVARSYIEYPPEALIEFVEAVITTLEQFEDALRTLKQSEASRHAEHAEDDALEMLGFYIMDVLWHCRQLRAPDPVSLTYIQTEPHVHLCRKVLNVGERISALLDEGPACAALSATLTVDGSFRFIAEACGIHPRFEDAMPPAFDFKRNAAIYTPPLDTIPDPSITRDPDSAPSYYQAVAEEVCRILHAVGGRCLVLFHSRKEMESVYQIVRESTTLPILVQRTSDAREVGDRFRSDVCSSLFAVRSFWTGFDAPGETLSCVIVVRIPFDVPVEPDQIVRQAWLRSCGLDPFRDYTLALAKMLVRQGTGRLLRSEKDRGVICLLDPRVRTRSYGRELIDNLPTMRVFERIEDALEHVGFVPASSRS